MKKLKLNRNQLRRLIEESFKSIDGQSNQQDFKDNSQNQVFDSPIQNFIDDDTAQFDAVMKKEEARYGLPFTNRDIRILLLNYVDKIEELSNQKDYRTLGDISGRVFNYLDNLKLKIDDLTAAYPAYSNKIDKSLSMFYYQSPDIGEDFKGYCKSILLGSDRDNDILVSDQLSDIIKQVIIMSSSGESFTNNHDKWGPAVKHIRQGEILEKLNSISSYQLIQLSKGITVSKYGPGTSSSNLFNNFIRVRSATGHIQKVKERIDSSMLAIDNFLKVTEGTLNIEDFGDDVGYLGTDLVEELLNSFTTAFRNVDEDKMSPLSLSLEDLIQNDLYDAMLNNEYRNAYRIINNIIRKSEKVIRTGSAGQGFVQSDERDARFSYKRNLQKIKSYLSGLRFDLDSHIKRLLRELRKSLEGFQTLFENNRRNKMKLNRRQLRKLILKEFRLVEKMLVQPDGSVVNTRPELYRNFDSEKHGKVSLPGDTDISTEDDILDVGKTVVDKLSGGMGRPRSFDHNIAQRLDTAITAPTNLLRPFGKISGTFYIDPNPAGGLSFSGARKHPVYMSFIKSPVIKIGLFDSAYDDLPEKASVGEPFMGSVSLDDTGALDFSTFTVTYP